VILFLLNTKDDILKNVSNQTGPVDFHSWKKKILWKSMGVVNCLVTHILQNIFFCVQQKKRKETQTGLEQMVKIFIFG